MLNNPNYLAKIMTCNKKEKKKKKEDNTVPMTDAYFPTHIYIYISKSAVSLYV